MRHEDFFATDRMDVYALVLRQSAAGLKDLNQLAHALLPTGPARPTRLSTGTHRRAGGRGAVVL